MKYRKGISIQKTNKQKTPKYVILNNVVRGGLTEKVTFKQRLQEMREQAMWVSQGKTVQAEGRANIKAFKQGHAC